MNRPHLLAGSFVLASPDVASAPEAVAPPSNAPTAGMGSGAKAYLKLLDGKAVILDGLVRVEDARGSRHRARHGTAWIVPLAGKATDRTMSFALQ